MSRRLALFSASSGAGLVDAIGRGREGTEGGYARAAIVEPTEDRIAQTVTIAERGKAWRGRDGIWFSPLGLLAEGGTLALLFPGADAAFEPRVDDVARHFGLPLPSCTEPKNLQELGIGIIGVNRLFDGVFRSLGVRPNDVAGHSIGEWNGMIATGMVPEDAVDRFMATLQPGSIEVPGVVFATAGCGVERAVPALAGLAEIALSHDNCPHQVLICGVETSVDRAVARLRVDGVLCQKLPFRSGFHSPLFADYIDVHRENFARLPLVSPRSTLWSATTCAPYPNAPDAIRELAIEHLVRPVRFRELIEALYAQGTRVFLQAGAGSLVPFVEDTLRGRPHTAILANSKERTGMQQLERVAAALFVEGASLDFDRLIEPEPADDPVSGRPGSPPADSPDDPIGRRNALLAEFTASLAAVAEAQREVIDRFATLQRRGPLEATTQRTLSIESFPELVDHTFVRQPQGWPTMSDRQPVVPMTMLVHLMMDHAARLCPGRVAVEVENVRAHRWLVVAPPVDARVLCNFDERERDPDPDRVRVRVVIDDYCEGVVVFASTYPTAPAADDAPTVGAGPTLEALPARALYDGRWLFHGPAFQGIVNVDWLGASGISGRLDTGSALGALLDNAGQLFGYWVMALHEVDRMAMPIRLARVRFFGPHPQQGDRLRCTVHVRSVDDKSAVGDLNLDRDGAVWATIEGWENRRFETDSALWEVMRWPERSLLSEVRPQGMVVFEDHYRLATTRDRLARRFLGEGERAQYERQTPRKQRSWLAGRIAAKDAVRDLLWRRGHGPLFPVEVRIDSERSGRPVVRTATGHDVRVSIAHKDDIAVAMARIGTPVGIDIEHVEDRTQAFAELAFSRDELRLVAGDAPDEAWTRLWAAKEAAAKAAGTGLGGAPSRFPIRDRAGERLLVGDTWVITNRHRDFIVAWTNT